MTISFNWLKDYLKFDLSAEKVADILTSTGLEVEHVETVEQIPGGLAGVIVAEVVECVPHPDSDHLHITKLNTGAPELLQVVCGAPNVAQGQKVLLATVGTELPTDDGSKFKIKRSKIRGAESNGGVSYREGKIDYNGMLYDELVFEAVTISTLFAEPSFIIYRQDGPERFAGTLKFIVDGGKVCAVNIIGAEDYLMSVVSTSGAADLKSQAVSTRRWLLSQVERRHAHKAVIGGPGLDSTPSLVTWLEHRPQEEEKKAEETPAHLRFDVCASEHCRPYYGITDKADAAVRAAIDETWGQL